MDYQINPLNNSFDNSDGNVGFVNEDNIEFGNFDYGYNEGNGNSNDTFQNNNSGVVPDFNYNVNNSVQDDNITVFNPMAQQQNQYNNNQKQNYNVNNPPQINNNMTNNNGNNMNQFNPQSILEGAISNEALNIGTNMAFTLGSQQMGKVEEKVEGYFNFLKYYFAVNNSYVLRKLFIVIFPFIHTDWRRRQQTITSMSDDSSPSQTQNYKLPREDINAPDLYIPLMSFVTLILLVGFCMGANYQFTPEVLGEAATRGIIAISIELLILWFGCYLVSESPNIIDLLSYSGYIFPGVIINIFIGLIFGDFSYYISLIITSCCSGFFMLKTVKELTNKGYNENNKIIFRIIMALLQILVAWFLGNNVLFYQIENMTEENFPVQVKVHYNVEDDENGEQIVAFHGQI